MELLCKSMNINEVKEVQSLQDIGKEIVHKCGGLPLAITLIARALATKEKTENQWRMFLNKSAWSMSKLPCELRGALFLSYDELPRHLKQCFLYCALFPEDAEMCCNDLVRYWVSEGFVEGQDGQHLEDTALEYYYELIYRNVLQPDPIHFDHSWCKMHDLLRNLAQHISGEESFCGDPELCEAKTKLQRVSVVTDKDKVVFHSQDKQKLRLRTLLSISCESLLDTSMQFSGCFHAFRMLPCIQLLDLRDPLIQSIPDCIGNLIHLRLLDLDRTDITYIPESIGSLINLQILNLQGCDALRSLPLAITKLCNLRRLGLFGTPINQVPKGIGRLEFLNDLEGFRVGGESDNGKTQDGWLEELGQLLQLRPLDMVELERAVPSGADPLLADKNHLKVLKLLCSEQTEETYPDEAVRNIEKIFEQLIPPRNLEELLIFGLFSWRYPAWLGTAHLSALRELTLRNCKFWEHFPPIGQLPNLKYLNIVGATAVTKVGPEFVGCTEAVTFPKLEWFIIRDMPNWKKWSFVEEEEDAAGGKATKGGEDGYDEKGKREAPSPNMRLLPCLTILNLTDCPKLRALPRQLGQVATSLKELDIMGAGCLQVVEDLPYLSKHLQIVDCDGLERVSKVPQVPELRLSLCTNLRCVEELSSLQQLWLDEDMNGISSRWVTGLQNEHRQLYGEDLDVYTCT